MADLILKLKPSKFNFLMEKVGYLGFLIYKEALKPDQAKIRVILKMALSFLHNLNNLKIFFKNHYKIL